MSFAEQLLREYGYDRPIILEKLYDKGRSEISVRKALARLTERGILARFSAGVYYFPKKTMLGPTLLDAREVCEKKFIRDETGVFGYYSGLTFENMIGVTMQMPNVTEITTNNASARVRDIRMGGQKFRLRKSRTIITSENAKILPLLDLLNVRSADSLRETSDKLTAYLNRHGIGKEELISCVGYYPARVSKRLIESGLIHALT